MNANQMFAQIELIQMNYKNGLITEREALDAITDAVVTYHNQNPS